MTFYTTLANYYLFRILKETFYFVKLRLYCSAAIFLNNEERSINEISQLNGLLSKTIEAFLLDSYVHRSEVEMKFSFPEHHVWCVVPLLTFPKTAIIIAIKIKYAHSFYVQTVQPILNMNLMHKRTLLIVLIAYHCHLSWFV